LKLKKEPATETKTARQQVEVIFSFPFL